MLTPQEVKSRAFQRASFGGYNMGQVDEFLDILTEDYTALYNDNAVLKSKMKVLVDKVEEYRSTEEAMRIGAQVGYRGMVREIVSELGRGFGCDFRLVATGGFAGWVLSGLDLPFVVDPTLTLYGIGLVCSHGF